MHLNQILIPMLPSKQTFLRLALVLPLISMLSACGGKVELGKDSSMSAPSVTRGEALPEFPDDTPSSVDGKALWANSKQSTCAQCHGDGTGGSAGVNFSDKAWADKQKPVDEYMFVAYGKKPDGTQVKNHTFDTLTKRERWDLVFYIRSLARPIIAFSNTPEYLALDATFGSNCAVCHGKKGNGDGPLAHNLEPVPANFANFPRFYDRSDAVLWDHIANGIPWEGMPNFQTHGKPKHDKAKNVTFDDAYIWKLVQYVRHFQSVDVASNIAIDEPKNNSAQKSTSEAAEPKSGQNQSKSAP